MHRILLTLELRSISPEAKFFLARFLQLYGLNHSVRIGVKELSKVTDATDRVVSRSLNELVLAELIVHKKIADGRGRPKSEYTCSLRLTKLLQQKFKNALSIHDAKIDYVLGDTSGKDQAELNVSNRLLIALLLVYADQFGVVRNMGLSDLSKQTGLNRERVKAQLQKVHSLGIIRSYVSGATTSQLFGPTKSIYFLNLHSTAINPSGQNATILIRTSEKDSELIGINEASWIIQATDACKGGAFYTNSWTRNFFPSDEKFNTLAPLFYPLAKNSKTPLLLQTKIEEYASTLLSKHWKTLPSTLPNIREFFLDEELIRLITRDFSPPIGKKTSPNIKVPPDKRTTLLADFIYQVAFLLACRTKKIFPAIERLRFKNIDFLILPSSNLGSIGNTYTGSRALLIISHEDLSEKRCYVIRRSENGELNHEEFAHEDDIAIESKFRYGLLTKNIVPKRYNPGKH